MNKSMKIQLELKRRMPLLKGEHRTPVQPKVAVKKLVSDNFIDPLVLHLLTGSKKHLHEILLCTLAQREAPVGVGVLAPVDRHPLERVVGIVLIEPVELVEDACPLHFDRRNGPEEVPETFEVVFHLSPTADHETFCRLHDPVQRTSWKGETLQDSDP
jgi:hypothetical protein